MAQVMDEKFIGRDSESSLYSEDIVRGEKQVYVAAATVKTFKFLAAAE